MDSFFGGSLFLGGVTVINDPCLYTLRGVYGVAHYPDAPCRAYFVFHDGASGLQLAGLCVS